MNFPGFRFLMVLTSFLGFPSPFHEFHYPEICVDTADDHGTHCWYPKIRFPQEIAQRNDLYFNQRILAGYPSNGHAHPLKVFHNQPDENFLNQECLKDDKCTGWVKHRAGFGTPGPYDGLLEPGSGMLVQGTPALVPASGYLSGLKIPKDWMHQLPQTPIENL